MLPFICCCFTVFAEAGAPNWELYRPDVTKFNLPGSLGLVQCKFFDQKFDQKPLEKILDFDKLVSDMMAHV